MVSSLPLWGRTRNSAPVLPPPWEVRDKQGRRIANKAQIRETHIPGWTHPGKRFTLEQGLKERTVIIEYPSLEMATAAYSSPAYAEAFKALGEVVRDFTAENYCRL